MRPELALVPGEPAGIGPELCVRLVQQPREDCRLLAFADPDTLRAAAAALNLPLQLLPEDAEARVPGDLRLRDVRNAAPSRFGQADPANAGAVIGALLGAGQACLSGELHGVVTGPVHKAAINDGGIAFTGTTGLLAAQEKGLETLADRRPALGQQVQVPLSLLLFHHPREQQRHKLPVRQQRGGDLLQHVACITALIEPDRRRFQTLEPGCEQGHVDRLPGRRKPVQGRAADARPAREFAEGAAWMADQGSCQGVVQVAAGACCGRSHESTEVWARPHASMNHQLIN